jgi:hypothetical protein
MEASAPLEAASPHGAKLAPNGGRYSAEIHSCSTLEAAAQLEFTAPVEATAPLEAAAPQRLLLH